MPTKKTTKKEKWETYSAPQWAWRKIWGQINRAKKLDDGLKRADKTVIFDGEGSGPLCSGQINIPELED